MPAGSGPAVAIATSGSIAASEVAVVTLAPSNWANALGNLLEFNVNYNASAAQTITFRVRQGNGITGTLVGIAHAVVVAAAGVQIYSMMEADTSAFAQLQQQGQYTLTMQSSIAGPGTVNYATLAIETISTLS